MASESWMLGFVFVSMFLLSAKDLCKASCQRQIQACVLQELYLKDIPFKARSRPLGPRSWPNRSSDHLHSKRQSLAKHRELCAPLRRRGVQVLSCQKNS